MCLSRSDVVTVCGSALDDDDDDKALGPKHQYVCEG
jgi:hypothetical protein